MLTALRILWGRCRQVLAITNENGGGPPAKVKPEVVVVETARALPAPARSSRAEPSEPLDPRRRLERECYVLPYNHARRSWELEPNEATLKALEAEGASRAMALHRARSEAKEQRQTAKFQDLAAKEKRLLAARDRARAVAQARRQEFAKLGTPQPRPAIPPVLIHTATLSLAISIAVPLHDLFVGFDPYLKWLAGGGCAWAVSVLIIRGILPTGAVQQDHKEQSRRTSVFYAGLAFGVALFGVRMTTAGTFGDFLFAAALTLAEFSVLWLWEKRAQQLGHELAAWLAEEISRGRLYEQSQAANDNLDDRQKELDQNQKETQALERECELDHVLSDLKTLIAIATNAIRGGYHAGIAENNGAVNGGGDLGPDRRSLEGSKQGQGEPQQPGGEEEEEDDHAK